MFLSKYKSFALVIASALYAASCGTSYNNQGLEYAPDMYHPVAYEPLKQITDTTAGRWRNTWGPNDNWGDFFSSNVNNPHNMNMREPVHGTVSRRRYRTTYMGAGGSGDTVTTTQVSNLMIYNIPKDSLEYAARTLTNPIPRNDQTLAEGKILYARFCQHCHGENGQGNGPVAAQYRGIPSYQSDAVRDVSGGHVYHVITHGKGRMWPHGSQMDPADRWKIVHYVNTLQQM